MERIRPPEAFGAIAAVGGCHYARVRAIAGKNAKNPEKVHLVVIIKGNSNKSGNKNNSGKSEISGKIPSVIHKRGLKPWRAGTQ